MLKRSRHLHPIYFPQPYLLHNLISLNVFCWKILCVSFFLVISFYFSLYVFCLSLTIYLSFDIFLSIIFFHSFSLFFYLYPLPHFFTNSLPPSFPFLLVLAHNSPVWPSSLALLVTWWESVMALGSEQSIFLVRIINWFSVILFVIFVQVMD